MRSPSPWPCTCGRHGERRHFAGAAPRGTDRARRSRRSRRRARSRCSWPMSRSISVRSRLTSVPSRSNGSISCRMPPTSSARGLAQALELLVDHHRADAVVREHLHAAARRRPRTAGCASARRRLGRPHAVLQVEARCRSAAAARGSAASRRSASASASSVSIGAVRRRRAPRGCPAPRSRRAACRPAARSRCWWPRLPSSG